MAKCSVCGGELFPSSKFCPQCGAPTEMSDADVPKTASDPTANNQVNTQPAQQAENAENGTASSPETDGGEIKDKSEDGSNSDGADKKKLPVIPVAAAAVIVIIVGVVIANRVPSGPTPVQTFPVLETTTTTATTATAATGRVTVTTTAAETTTTTAATTTASSAAAVIDDVVIYPTHSPASGRNISCQFLLSDYDINLADYSENARFIAEYNCPVNAGDLALAVMVISIDKTDVEVLPAESSDGIAVFLLSDMLRNSALGNYTAEDIDSISFRSNGPSVDVSAITISNE